MHRNQHHNPYETTHEQPGRSYPRTEADIIADGKAVLAAVAGGWDKYAQAGFEESTHKIGAEARDEIFGTNEAYLMELREREAGDEPRES